jgi:hypothetical protein
MSHASLATMIMGSQAGLTRTQLGVSMERMNADRGASIANLVDSAQQNLKSLANVSPSTGGRLNVRA